MLTCCLADVVVSNMLWPCELNQVILWQAKHASGAYASSQVCSGAHVYLNMLPGQVCSWSMCVFKYAPRGNMLLEQVCIQYAPGAICSWSRCVFNMLPGQYAPGAGVNSSMLSGAIRSWSMYVFICSQGQYAQAPWTWGNMHMLLEHIAPNKLYSFYGSWQNLTEEWKSYYST